ncbi:LytR/AlgR family response regulator transcription factor [Clostridium tagluense]|uniref:LytR/AlgR family response regulator transcription factor n=1 Tax=Clostridium tagluense TaxID=360422 RepID=UPI001CF5DD33|nr:LytTR family DNA-binding domain-containing protein [Clostridium tagluense]MCB2296455.1 LytTR family DNA-binding domain-containing protein [Clostridium tagluense]
MINIAICDDDIGELNIISIFISKIIENLNISFKITVFNQGLDLMEHMRSPKESFDILFLDIYMKDSNGIDIARKIREFDEECKIIFITSSQEHAIDSYEVRATYYILKPVNEEKLSTAIKIAMEGLDKENKQILIINKKGSYKVLYKDILYGESKARIVNIYLKSHEVITFYSKLEDFFQKLQDERFLKSHKSFIVNMDYISKIENNSIFMINNSNIPISIANITEIKEKYFKYLLKYT